MRKLSIFVAAFVLTLGLAQCKKEQPAAQNETEGVRITLNVGPSTGSGTNGSRVDVNPDAQQQVTFTDGDEILVGYNGAYVGTLTYNSSHFEGSISATPSGDQPLYFYFLGNNAVLNAPVDGEIKGCTVNISDQTGYPALPVISFSASNRVFDGEGSYSAVLQNKCSLMKFKVTTDSDAAVCITGMNNHVTVMFDDRTTNDGFSYGKADAEGVIKLKGGSGTNVEKWAIVLRHEAYDEEGIGGTVYTEDINYVGCRPELPAIDMDEYFDTGIALTVSENPVINLSDISENTTIGNHRTLIGSLSSGKYISIAPDATVTLNGVNIDNHNSSNDSPGIKCLGNATLILVGSNSIQANQQVAIQAPPTGSTLVIESNSDNPGTLTATSMSNRAIGGGNFTGAVGNITINGGNITATGGIGGYDNSCGNITINGGTVNVPNTVRQCAAIGSGSNVACDTITINGGTVTATNSTNDNSSAGAGIGSGYRGSCGIIIINGGTVSAQGGGRINGGAAAIGCGYQGSCLGVVIGNGITKIEAKIIPFSGKRIGASTSGGTFGGLTIGNHNYGNNSEPTSTGNIPDSELKVTKNNPLTIEHQ